MARIDEIGPWVAQVRRHEDATTPHNVGVFVHPLGNVPPGFSAEAARLARFVLGFCWWPDLNQAARLIGRALLLPPNDGSPGINGVSVKLDGDGERARFRVDRDAVTFALEHPPWGRVDIVGETPHIGVVRLNIDPGAEIPTHFHSRMAERELVLDQGLVVWRDQAPPRRAAPGQQFRWQRHQRHGWRNQGTRPAGLLCLNSPPFDPADEIVAPEGPDPHPPQSPVPT